MVKISEDFKDWFWMGMVVLAIAALTLIVKVAI